MTELRFFNPYAKIRHTENRLPHWQQEGAVYFVTFRLAETLHHFQGERVVMISFVVMPNHVHALFVQNLEFPLEKLIRSWKGFTARQINKLLGRSGNFWQRDYFDRLVRDEKHSANCVRYIRRNPEKARLSNHEFILWESEIANAMA